ncbi:MAG TPA: cell division protein FtsA [Bacteroidales bacterium]|jgi:cell division protein FtsA|nr:cell division protein FtsA [Bacteroidales bacterium]MDI9574699.1 cell division protein FtsA [Bacteroidota bacterium]OQC60846.1 MAG: Cell division protein FtsA [Bacteroidetes bacterium ADurb.Bin012]MBP9511131.1 cell division protein FtsA [Bacteroidales bacterium]MBP9588371.1 cell division protein FtsA [Bacteroidales bacterium]
METKERIADLGEIVDPSDIYVTSLDIGTTKIAAIVGRRNENNKVEILGYGRSDSLGVRRGVVTNIENTVQSIQNAVRQAEERSGKKIKYVHVGIAGHHIKSMQHRGTLIRKNGEDEITQEDIENLINNMYSLNMNPGEEIIDVIPQEFTVDGESGIKNPVGVLGTSLEANFHIITGQTAAAKNIYKCVKKAGLEIVDLIIEPFASSEAVLSPEEKEAGVVLVDVGGGTTDLAIFQDDIIRHTAVIPFGGEIVTEDVKEGCSIIRKHAEELKIKFGSSLASENRDEDVVSIPGLRGRPPKEITLKNLASIIQARMEEIMEYVYREIVNSGLERKLIAGIVLTGGGSQLRHLKQLTEFISGMDTRIGYPNEHLSPRCPSELASPMYATGIGLLLMALERTERDLKKRAVLSQTSTKIQEQPVDVPIFEEKQSEKFVDKEPKKSKRESFLERITKWFEDDGL